jgi:hypothetical protein
MWAILRNVLALILCGITIGLPLAKASARTIRSLLYSLAPFDPWTLSVVVITILAVAASASYIPARRASHVDPSDKVSTCIAGDGKTASTISTAKSIPTWKREPPINWRTSFLSTKPATPPNALGNTTLVRRTLAEHPSHYRRSIRCTRVCTRAPRAWKRGQHYGRFAQSANRGLRNRHWIGQIGLHAD